MISFLPIVERELRVASRRRATYWLRCFLALAVGGIWFLLLVIGEHSLPAAQRGKILFMSIGIVTFAFCLFAGVFLTADCVSEEKREGTLGLLFLTELKGYDVVIGKLIATSLHAFYGVLSVLPLMALPLLLGGVSVGEFWRTTAALLSTLAFSLAVGMFVSVLSRETRQAMVATFLILVVLAGVLPLVSSVGALLFGPKWALLRDLLSWPSPGYLYVRSADQWFTGQFWGSLLTLILLTVGALVAASLRLPVAWRDKGERSARRPEARALESPVTVTQPAALRNVLERNPFQWLALRDGRPRTLALRTVSLLLPLWFCFIAGCFTPAGPLQRMSFAMSLLLAYGIHQVVKYFIAIEASRRFNEDLRSGALELLLVSPLSTEQILAGQRGALRDLFATPMLLVLITNITLLWLMLGPDPVGVGRFEGPLFCEIFIGGAIMLWVDFHTLSWIGMWMGLQKRRHHRAILATLARVMLAPWLAIAVLFFLSFGAGPINSPTIHVLIAFWFLLGAAIEFSFMVRARAGLKETLREPLMAAKAPELAIPPIIPQPPRLATRSGMLE